MQLTPNFSTDEMKCPCCGKCEMDPSFMTKLQTLRACLQLELKVTSAYRCAAHNAAVGGKPDSLHLLGRAADIFCPDSGFRWRLLDQALLEPFLGIGLAKTYIHVDDRGRDADKVPSPAAWTYYP